MASAAGSGDAWRISGEDRAKHDSQFFALKPVNGFITGEQARGFFMQSGLPTPVLGQIWGLADMNNDGKMDKKEFSIAMHLIKKRLQGYELPKSIPAQLKQDPAPVIGSFGTMPQTQPPAMGMGMAPNMGLPPAAMGMGARMPLMANGMPQMAFMGSGPLPAQPGGFAGGVPVRTGTPPAGGGNMSIPHQNKLKYTQMFNSHDRNKRGTLTGVEARSILMQTGVPQQMLAQIWTLSDVDKDGKLDCEEFCIALHLTDLVKLGQVLPAKLPPDLLAAKARAGSFGSTPPMPATGGAAPQKDNFGELLGGMGMQQAPPPQPVANGESKPEDPQDLATFEDKRKQNFDKGQAELERRRQQLQETMRKENEARLDKERKEHEKREKIRQEQELKRQQQLEKQLEKQRAIEREKDEQRKKMMEQREAARRELERQRQMEWERQRKEQLMVEKAREYEQLSALKSQSSNLRGELETLQGKKAEMNGKISQVKNGVTDFTAHIEAMRSTRDLKNQDIDRLQKELQDLNQKLRDVQSDRETLDLRVQTSIQSNPMSETHRTMMHSVELKKTSVQKLKKDLEQIEKDTETRLAEIDNLNTQFKEFNSCIASLQSDISQTALQNADKAKQSADEAAAVKKDKDKHDKLRRELEAQRKKEESAAKSPPAPGQPGDSVGGGWAAFSSSTATAAPSTAPGSDNWASVFDSQPGAAHTTTTSIDWGASLTSHTTPATSDAKVFKLSGAKKKYEALYQFEARNVDELTLNVGDTVMVFTDQTGAEPGWKGGEISGKCGWFPEAYVEQVEEDSSQAVAGGAPAETGTAGAGLMSSEDSSFMTVPVKIPAVSPTPGQGEAAPAGLQAQALYPWKAKKDNHLSFNKGEVISVREQQDMWWSGELNGKVGWFPKSYVKLISGPSAVPSVAATEGSQSPVVTSSQPAANGTLSPAVGLATGEAYVAVYTYQSNEPGDLTFNQGDIIAVTKNEGDWWAGSFADRTGIFPANYVKKTDQPLPQQPTQSLPDPFSALNEPSQAGDEPVTDKSPTPDTAPDTAPDTTTCGTDSVTPDPSDTHTKVNSPMPADPFSGFGSTNTVDSALGLTDDVFKASDPFSDTSGFNSGDSGTTGQSPFTNDPFAEFGKSDNIESSKVPTVSGNLNETVNKISFQSSDIMKEIKPSSDPFANIGGLSSPVLTENETKLSDLGDMFLNKGVSSGEMLTTTHNMAGSDVIDAGTKSDAFTDVGGLANAFANIAETSPLDVSEAKDSGKVSAAAVVGVQSEPTVSSTEASIPDSADKLDTSDPGAAFTDTSGSDKSDNPDPFSAFSSTNIAPRGDKLENSDPFAALSTPSGSSLSNQVDCKVENSEPFAAFPATSVAAAADKADTSDPFTAFSSDSGLSTDPFADSTLNSDPFAESGFNSDPFADSGLTSDPFSGSDQTFGSSPVEAVLASAAAPMSSPFLDSPSSLVQCIEDDAGSSLPQNLDLIQSREQNPGSCDSSIQTSHSIMNLTSLDAPKPLAEPESAAPPIPGKASLQQSLNKPGLNPFDGIQSSSSEIDKPSPETKTGSPIRPDGPPKRPDGPPKRPDAPPKRPDAPPKKPDESVAKVAPPAAAAPGAGGSGTLKKPEIATVIAAYTATGEEQLSLSPGQLIQVRKKSASGWWEGELQARGQKRKIGWFPANYVKLLGASARNTPDNTLGASGTSSPAQLQSGQRSDGPSPAPTPQPTTSPPSATSCIEHVIALYPYMAQNPDELTFQKDAVIAVTRRDDPDWWAGELNGQTGMFPANYVQSTSPEATSWSTDPQVLALTSREEGRRQSYIKELCDTEETYMADMSIVLDAFYKPLQQNSALTEEQLAQIFVNWKELIVCNTKLQKALRVRKKMCGGGGQVITSIGDILCENIPHLTPYIRFCSCQLNAAALLQKIAENNAKFQEIHKKCVQNPKTKGMPLSSFLLKPMQRITKYPLIVEKILSHTPASHPDHVHLCEALEHCQELCSQVNEGVREKENSDRLEWIQQRVNCDGLPEKITFNSVTNCLGPRKLVHNGVVYKTKSNKELGAFLFNDFLLLTTCNRPLNSSTHNLFDTSGNVQYKMYKSPIVLNEVMIKKAGVEESESFTVSHIDRVYNLRCHNTSERDTWVRHLDTASRHYLDTERKKREKAISSPKVSQGVGRLLVLILEGSNLISCKDVRRTPGVGRLLVVIIEGKDLQACDDNGKSDPYCEVSMGAQEHKTKVIQNTLNPRWNASMQFVIRDVEMDSLCITVFDRDLFSPNDFLGRTEMRVKEILCEAGRAEGRGPIMKRLLLHEVPTGEVLVKLDLQLYEQAS